MKMMVADEGQKPFHFRPFGGCVIEGKCLIWPAKRMLFFTRAVSMCTFGGSSKMCILCTGVRIVAQRAVKGAKR